MLPVQQAVSAVQRVDQVIERNLRRYVEDMKEAVRHPSVSTTGKGIRDMAQFLVEHFKSIGFGAQLESVVRQNAQLLQADALVGAEGSIYANGRPGMVMGTKGMLYVELVAHGSGRDLHSGKAPVVQTRPGALPGHWPL